MAKTGVITAPEPGALLEGSEVVFSWSDVGAESYILRVGSSPGDGTYLDEQTQGTSATALDLPTDGATIYVRLWTETAADQWDYQDTSYTAQSLPAIDATTILSPPRRYQSLTGK